MDNPISLIVLSSRRPVVLNPHSLVVIQQACAHDVIAAVIKGGDDESRVYETGMPLSVQWGYQNGEVKTAYGYAHHTEPIMGKGGLGQAQTLKFVAIGASYVLKQPAQNIWVGRTVSSVVQEIADGVLFSTQIGDHPQVWNNLSQDGKPSWDFLASLASKLGWLLYADNTDLHFHEYLPDFQGMRDNAVLFGAGRNPVGPGSVITFHAIRGETVPGAGIKGGRRLGGVDPRSGDVFTLEDDGEVWPGGVMGAKTQAPLFLQYEDMAAGSLDEARSQIDGATQANRWYIQAKAEVTGTPRIRPGVLAAFDGLGKRHDGYWYVQAVEHEIIGGRYRMYLDLGRDSEWDQYLRPDPRARRSITGAQNVVPDTILTNGVWRAAHGAGVSGAG